MNETQVGGRVVAHTDGSCRPNPGKGGWGVVLHHYPDDGTSAPVVTKLSGFHPDTTNNRMELMAAIAALEATPPGTRIEIVTDSRHVVDGMTEWRHKWAANGWRTATKKPVLNGDLWGKLSALADERHVTWTWIKAHVGHRHNEEADRLANAAAIHQLA